MRVLVTGVTGFIGYSLAERLVQRGFQVYGLVRFTSTTRRIPEGVSVITADLLDYHSVVKAVQEVKPEIVFHLAALTPVSESFHMPVAYAETNYIGTIHLCEALRKHSYETLQLFAFAGTSVTGDTPILVRDKETGEAKLIEIRELEKDDYRKYEVLTVDRNYNVKFLPIKGFSKHKPVKPIYKVKYEGGWIRLTGDHTIFVLDPETFEIRLKNVDELKEGDWLITYGAIDEADDVKRVLEILRRYNEGISEEVLKDFCRLLGYITAEGSIYFKEKHRTYRVTIVFNKMEEDKINDCVEILKKLGLNPRLVNDGNAVRIIVNSKWLAKLCLDLLKGKSKERELPFILWYLPKEYVIEFIRGYMGDASRIRKRGQVAFTSTSKKLAIGFMWLLRKLGMNAFVCLRRNKDHYSEKIGYVVKGGECYDIIVAKESLVREKLVDVEISGRARSPHADCVPSVVFKRIMDVIGKKLSHDIVSCIKVDKAISKEKAKEIIKYLKANEVNEEIVEVIKKIEKIVDSHLGFVQIKKIEVEGFDEEVYDISVDGLEAFFAGYCPVLVHNTEMFDTSAGITPETPFSPTSPYAVSKIAAYYYLYYMWKTYRFPVTIVIPTNTYGRAKVGQRHFVIEKIITSMLEGKKRILMGNPYARRDFMFREDHVEAYVKVMEAALDGNKRELVIGDAFSFGTGKAYTIKEVFDKCRELIGWCGEVVWGVYARPNEPQTILVNPEKAVRVLGWSPRYSLDRGLRKAVEEWREALGL